jgi:hypothetical protein
MRHIALFILLAAVAAFVAIIPARAFIEHGALMGSVNGGSGGGGGGGILCDIGPTYGGSVPAAASLAGFTHCAANYDFTQTLPGSWLDCTGPLNSPPTSPPPGSWFFYNTNNSCSNLVQVTDQGELALNMPLLSSDDLAGSELDTISTFPNAYYEMVFRFQTTPDPGLAGGYNSPGSYAALYEWYYPFPVSPSGIEQDNVEEFFGGATQYVSDNLIDWNTGGSASAFGGNSAPSNYDPRVYATWGGLFTGNGTVVGQESFLNGTKLGQASYNLTAASQQSTYRHWSKIALSVDCAFGGLGAHSCVNAPINSVYQCSANICVHFSSAIGVFNGNPNYGSISGVSGTGALPAAVNTKFNNVTAQSGCSGNSCTDINLNVAWPGGTYTSGGTYNPFTRIDMYIRSLRVWACSSWQTTMCQTSVNP